MARIMFVALFALWAVSMAGCPAATGGNGNSDLNDDPSTVAVFAGDGFVATTRAGQATGQQETAICDGWFPLEGNHVLNIRDGVSLTVRITGDTEPRLWVLCGQSNFCGTIVSENTAELSRFWNTGSCEVFAGTPDESGELDYTLEFIAN